MRENTLRAPFRLRFFSLPALLLVFVLIVSLSSSTASALSTASSPEITACPQSLSIGADPLVSSTTALLDLRKRTERDDDEDESTSSTRRRAPSTTEPSSSSATRPSIIRPSASNIMSSDIIMATPTVPVGPLPSAYDSSIGNSSFITESCKDFFFGFLKNSTFKACYPVSLLLPTSQGFFAAQKSFVSITRVLDASCSVDSLKCNDLLSRLARELVTKNVCDKDLDEQNPIVVTARNGFVSYKPMHDATCLKNPDTGSYCFADALSSEQTAGNIFVYHLAVGTEFPGSTRPVCNKCLQATMEVYSQAAGIEGQPLASTYKPAAQQINIGCGPGFVPEAVKTAGAASLVPVSGLIYIALPLVAYTFLYFDTFL